MNDINNDPLKGRSVSSNSLVVLSPIMKRVLLFVFVLPRSILEKLLPEAFRDER